MLQPIITPTTSTAVPNAGLVVPRPVQLDQQSSTVRNLTANPVRQNAEAEESGADSQEDRNERVTTDGQVGNLPRFQGNGRGELLDIVV